jgi:hypothetical protein
MEKDVEQKHFIFFFKTKKETQTPRQASSSQECSSTFSYLIFSFFGLARSRSGSTDPSESELNPDPKQSFKQNDKPKLKASKLLLVTCSRDSSWSCSGDPGTDSRGTVSPETFYLHKQNSDSEGTGML